MNAVAVLETECLVLRRWEASDLAPFAALNADPSDDFDHPGLQPGHRLRRHVLYRLHNPALRSA
jgi:hypothetical protein